MVSYLKIIEQDSDVLHVPFRKVILMYSTEHKTRPWN